MAFVAFMAFLILLFVWVIGNLFGDSITIISQAQTYVEAIIFYLGQAMDIVWLFVPKTIALTCMGFSVAANLVRYAYKFLMWVLRKIPFAHIS